MTVATHWMDLMASILLWFGSLAGLMVSCSLIGQFLERRRSVGVSVREAQIESLETTNLRFRGEDVLLQSSQLMCGSAVFTVDYLQKLTALFLMCLEGELRLTSAFLEERVPRHYFDCEKKRRHLALTISSMFDSRRVSCLYGVILVVLRFCPTARLWCSNLRASSPIIFSLKEQNNVVAFWLDWRRYRSNGSFWMCTLTLISSHHSDDGHSRAFHPVSVRA